jgi:hypothetical protein
MLANRLRWEPSWEPFGVDRGGRAWTLVESEAYCWAIYGRMWTTTDTAWGSTDQEVGCSSRPGRAEEILLVAGDFTCPVFVEGFVQGDLWEPFARSAITLETDTLKMCR